MSSARFTEEELIKREFTEQPDGSWSRLGPDNRHIITSDNIIKKKPITAKASADNSPKYKSKLEERFAEYLELNWGCRSWAYEPEKFRLGNGAYYTPDFRVVHLNDEVHFYEVKGFWREAAKVRIKVAASLHPYKFYVVTWDKKVKDWNIEEVKT